MRDNANIAPKTHYKTKSCMRHLTQTPLPRSSVTLDFVVVAQSVCCRLINCIAVIPPQAPGLHSARSVDVAHGPSIPIHLLCATFVYVRLVANVALPSQCGAQTLKANYTILNRKYETLPNQNKFFTVEYVKQNNANLQSTIINVQNFSS